MQLPNQLGILAREYSHTNILVKLMMGIGYRQKVVEYKSGRGSIQRRFTAMSPIETR